MKIYFLLWEYFKDKKDVKQRLITQQQFIQAEDRNLAFLKYLEGESSPKGILEVTGLDLENVQAKALYAGILFRFRDRPVLKTMDDNTRGLVLIGVKSLLDCFEQF